MLQRSDFAFEFSDQFVSKVHNGHNSGSQKKLQPFFRVELAKCVAGKKRNVALLVSILLWVTKGQERLMALTPQTDRNYVLKTIPDLQDVPLLLD